MTQAKPFAIPKREVWEAFKTVRANRGAAGVDGQRIPDFEAQLAANLYKIWNRMSSGSYMPPPVRRVDIPVPAVETRAEERAAAAQTPPRSDAACSRPPVVNGDPASSAAHPPLVCLLSSQRGPTAL